MTVEFWKRLSADGDAMPVAVWTRKGNWFTCGTASNYTFPRLARALASCSLRSVSANYVFSQVCYSELIDTHFFVHSLAVCKNLALSFLSSWKMSTCVSFENQRLLTAAMSGSKGSSGLGLLTFSWMIVRTTQGSVNHTKTISCCLPDERVTAGFH